MWCLQRVPVPGRRLDVTMTEEMTFTPQSRIEFTHAPLEDGVRAGADGFYGLEPSTRGPASPSSSPSPRDCRCRAWRGRRWRRRCTRSSTTWATGSRPTCCASWGAAGEGPGARRHRVRRLATRAGPARRRPRGRGVVVPRAAAARTTRGVTASSGAGVTPPTAARSRPPSPASMPWSTSCTRSTRAASPTATGSLPGRWGRPSPGRRWAGWSTCPGWCPTYHRKPSRPTSAPGTRSSRCSPTRAARSSRCGPGS